MSVTVLTSVYGSHDQLPPAPEQTVGAKWLYVTDSDEDVPGWERIHEPRPHMHPRMAAKVAKCLPWQYAETDTVVWMDGSCRLLRRDVLELVLRVTEGHPLSQIRHPWRDCCFDEAEASQPIPKYQPYPILAQAEHYRRLGHPEHWGLWATGFMVWRTDGSWSTREKLVEFGEDWLCEQARWSYQDQISEAVCARWHGLKPHYLPITLHGSGVLEWAPHKDET